MECVAAVWAVVGLVKSLHRRFIVRVGRCWASDDVTRNVYDRSRRSASPYPSPSARGGRSLSSAWRASALVLLCAGTLAGQERWSWHSIDFGLFETGSAEWIVHTRLRTRQGELQQSRWGSILNFSPHSRVTLIGGYYYGRDEDTREEWRSFHRLFGGAETRVRQWGAATLAARGLAERFWGGGRPAFTRLRNRIRLTMDGRIRPYLSGEWFWDTQGYLAGRYSVGLRWRCCRWASVEIGYLYDARSAQLGPPRHGVVTQLRLDPRRGRRQENGSRQP